MNNEFWINSMVSVPVAELIVYWVSLITVGMIAGIGWALFFTNKKKQSRISVPFVCPFNKKEDCATVINEPSQYKDNQNHSGIG